MTFLLDTCVISELIKSKPSQSVVDWIRKQREADLYVSVLTVGELRKGISKLPESQRRKGLESWFQGAFLERFANRIIPLDIQCAVSWGLSAAHAEQIGNIIPIIDGLIGASAVVNGSVLVTRNVRDFKNLKVELLNPWN